MSRIRAWVVPTVVLWALLTALLAGCGGLPTSAGTRVERSLAPGFAVPGGLVRVLPPGPVDGAQPAAIVRGFFAAQTDPDDVYSVARSFLAPGAAWTPTTPTTVYAQLGVQTVPDPASGTAGQPPAPTPSVLADGVRTTVQVTFGLLGQLSQGGTYTALSGQRTVKVTLRVVGGQWRIETIPSGLVLSAGDLPRLYQPVTLWWLPTSSAAGAAMVPEMRWVPQSGSALPTTLVKALLAGPSTVLAPLVHTALPPGTTLRGSAAVLDSDVLVDLNRQAGGLQTADAQGLLRQLTRTLAQVPAVTGVRLTVEGQPLPLPGVPARAAVTFGDAVDVNASPAAKLYAVRGSAPAALTTDPAPALLALSALQAVTRVAVSWDGERAAALVPGGGDTSTVYLTAGGGSPTASGAAASYTSLSYDRAGELAVGTATGVLLVEPTGQRLAVAIEPVAADSGATAAKGGALPGPLGASLISPDGSRVAILAGPAGSRHVWVGALNREAATIRLTDLRDVTPSLLDVRSVSWEGATRLSLIGTARPGAFSLQEVAIDGSSLIPTPFSNFDPLAAAAVAAAANSRPVVEADGVLYALSGTGWQPVGSGRSPAYAS